MSGKEYVIKYAAMDQLYVMICNRISGWYNELEDWSGEYERLISMESFSGASAESAKAYLQEVHGLLVSFLQTTLQYYQARLLLYKIGYYDIDASLYSSIPQEILREVQDKLGRESETLQEVSDSIGRSVNSVSDLIYLKNPSIDNLKNTLDGLKSELGDFETEIGDYESSELQAVRSDVQGMIDSLQAAVLDYLNNGTSIPSYQPGAVAGNTNMLDLYQRAVAAGQYVEEHQEEIELAAAEQEKAFAQMQADYEAACEAREQEGQVKMLQGVLATGVGIAAIVFTAGAATPIVVTAAVTGGCSIAYGVSTATEGAQDWYLGSIGDLETAAVNPIRDTIFAGNQELYDRWGSLNMMVAGMCIPVGHAVNGAAGLGKGAVIKAASRTIVTETVKDRAVDYVSGEITTFATEHLNLNQVQSAVLNIGLNLGLDKGADWAGQKIGITEGPKFTDRMSYEDAKRYNQFMSEAELGIHNNHPGMSQADLDAWKLADAKVEEQLAVNKVNWDEVTALRAKELEAQKYHLNNSDGELQAKKPLENGPYIKDGKPKGRPQLHGKKKLEFEQEVYNNCVDPDGILRDPNTKQVIDWKPGQPRKDVVDFGHRPGYSYHEMFLKYKNQEISLDELKEFQFDPENYRLETPSANRSHKYE